MSNTIFNDAWFRVSGLRVALLDSVELTTQKFRGRTWHVLQDRYSQKYFRASPQACHFIQQLNLNQSVEEVWESFVNAHPRNAPSREEVIQLLSQLHTSNLLYSLHASDNEAIVKRYKTQRRKETLAKLGAFLFVRVPLWNPNTWLNSIRPLTNALTGWWALGIWLLVVVLGSVMAFENRNAIGDQSQGVLSASNLPWLYVSLAGLKFIHELGHAFVCKRFGGEVRVMGLMFLIFTPLPYVDASSSWGFPNRLHRIYVSFAGMAVDFFFAGIGAIVWSNTSPGLLNALAFNVMLIGSISSVLFNGNPLLRFDAYYMLSDFCEIPNLYQKGQQQWKYFADRYLLGTVAAHNPATDEKEWYWLTTYGLLSALYLIVVTLGISLFLLDFWLPLGILVLVMTLYSRIISPGFNLFKHLRGNATQGNRSRAVGVTVGIIASLFLIIGVVPFPDAIKTKGVVETEISGNVYIRTPGRLDHLFVTHGDWVQSGDPIARFVNPELDFDILISKSEQAEVRAIYRLALEQAPQELRAIQERINGLESQLERLQEQRGELNVYATMDGKWVAPDIHQLRGSWLRSDQVLGEIVDPNNLKFYAVVPQEEADILFKNTYTKAEIRLMGQADINLPVPKLTVIPFQREKLPSVALGWLGGGDIAVDTDEPDGMKSKEPFFIVQAALPVERSNAGIVLHGLSGTLRFALPHQPLASQMLRSLKQLMQKRFEL